MGKPWLRCISDARRRALLLMVGVKLSKDGKCVFNYNPGPFQAGLNFILAIPLLPPFLKLSHFLQLLGLIGFMQLYAWVISDATASGPGMLDLQIQWCYNNIAGLSRFVLGLFISLVLSKTYYANRGVFGTVFGSPWALRSWSPPGYGRRPRFPPTRPRGRARRRRSSCSFGGSTPRSG